MTFEEFYTIATQVEAPLNSRPLIPLSEIPTDLSVLTPGHFLIEESLRSNLEPSLLKEDNVVPMHWPLGRIYTISPAKAATVKNGSR